MSLSTSDIAAIKAAQCPCCGLQCVGVRPKHSLYNHLRRSNDEKHAPWKLQHMDAAFSRVKRCTHDRSDDAAAVAAVVKQLKHMYSDDTLARVSALLGSA